jgi:hypothetical protein
MQLGLIFNNPRNGKRCHQGGPRCHSQKPNSHSRSHRRRRFVTGDRTNHSVLQRHRLTDRD